MINFIIHKRPLDDIKYISSRDQKYKTHNFQSKLQNEFLFLI